MAKTTKKDMNKWELPEFQIKEFSRKKALYCVCIPVINEGEKLTKQLERMKPLSKIVDIIILDGGSTDGSTSPTFLKKQRVRALLIKKSLGKQGTQLRMGFAYALKQGYKGIITIDGNGKDGTEAIPEFINALEEGYDSVAGSRFIKGGKAINTPFGRLLGILLTASPLLSLAARHWYTDVTNGFMGYSRNYLLDPRVNPFRNIFVKYELLFYLDIRAAQLGLKTKELPVTRSYPKGQVPTKIRGLQSNLAVITTILNVMQGYYNPKQ